MGSHTRTHTFTVSGPVEYGEYMGVYKQLEKTWDPTVNPHEFYNFKNITRACPQTAFSFPTVFSCQLLWYVEEQRMPSIVCQMMVHQKVVLSESELWPSDAFLSWNLNTALPYHNKLYFEHTSWLNDSNYRHKVKQNWTCVCVWK